MQHFYASRGADSDTHNRLIETLITDTLAGIGSLGRYATTTFSSSFRSFVAASQLRDMRTGEHFLGRDPRITHKLVYPATLAGTRIIETTRRCAISPLLRFIRNDESLRTIRRAFHEFRADRKCSRYRHHMRTVRKMFPSGIY